MNNDIHFRITVFNAKQYELDVRFKGNDGELYFEADDFDDFNKTLRG